MQWRWLILGAVVILAAGAWQYRQDQAAKAADEAGAGGCRPEGGLACDGDTILVCKDGTPTPSGTCAGGCVDNDGVARCFDADKRLVAPVGAICRPGMGLCGMTPNTMLVCQDETLQKAADCPGGCVDEGERGGLYCLSESGHLRFPAGFACPQFKVRQAPYACGADGKMLLKCDDGVLQPHSVSCARCDQRKNGSIHCLNDMGDRVDLATGALIQ